MGTEIVETCFPRGSNKLKKRLKRDASPDNLFSRIKPPNAKKLKKNNKTKKLVAESESTTINITGTLSYNKIQTGMIILGCVRKIKNLSLEVELPGLTFAKVHITSITDEFTKQLASHLREMQENDENFDKNSPLKRLINVGDIVPVKVINVEQKDNSTVIESTINPKDINNGRRLESFNKNILIWACVQSKLEHGYQIDVGVNNCRAFLPFKNVNENKNYEIGTPLWCVIHKSDTSSSNTFAILRVSAKTEHLLKSKVDKIQNLDDAMVGMQVELFIEKITNNGLEGKFFDDFIGYVDQSQLKNPLDTLKNYNRSHLLNAFILYIEPVTKITHLTLRNFHNNNRLGPKLNVGDIVSGNVLAKTNNGIYLKLNNKEKGFVTNRRLVKALNKPLSIDVTDIVRLKYPIGSKHLCRILDYSQLLNEYVCTVESQIVKTNLFTADSLKIGQFVQITVDDIKNDGLVVSLGSIKGFVPNIHLSNAQYTETIKNKFYIGQKVNAKVYNICEDNNNVLFTLKKGFVQSKDCLYNFNDITTTVIDKHYTGMIVNTSQKGALVVFYGNTRGWLPASEIKVDPTEYFFYGQIAQFKIMKKFNNGKLLLSLLMQNDIKMEINVGQKNTGIVTKINESEIELNIKNKEITGILPIYHLSTTPDICRLILNTYKIGDEIENLICVRKEPLTFSRRESQALERSKIKLYKFDQLKQGILLRCSYMYTAKNGIYVYPLIKHYTERVLIKFDDIVNRHYKPHENITTKIVEFDGQTKTLTLSAKIQDVFNKKIEYSVKLFSEYLKDFNNIIAFNKKTNSPLCKYNPGEKINCKIDKLGKHGGCSIKLPNQINGIAVPYLCPDNLKVNQQIDGIILSYDFNNNFVDVCIKKTFYNRINHIQNGDCVMNDSLTSFVVVEKLLVKDRFIIGLLNSNANRQFVYIPLYLHENDIIGCHEYYKENKFKICLCGKVGNYIIGINKRLFIKLEKEYKRSKLVKKSEQLQNTKETVSEEEEVEVEEEEEVEAEEEDVEAEEEDVEVEEEEVEVEEEDVEEVECEEKNTINLEEIKQKQDNLMPIVKASEYSNNNGDLKPILPGITSFYSSSSTNSKEIKEESSSEDSDNNDDDEEKQLVKKKKKLTPKERNDMAREEEERIRKIEKDLADSALQPQNAEQFDRLLLANPNSSILWTRYISFHISSTELDKARAVGKRALEAIDVTLTQERFNIWIALLHLENLYGTAESFNNLFEEAVRCNDSLQIYLKVIEMFAESGKLLEMEEKIKKVRNKHKQNVEMWLEVAKVYYMLKNFKEARNMKHFALKSIQDKKIQLNLIIRFAVMEFKYGEKEQGAAIFETIISSDPKKINVWTTYVDQLIKSNQIDLARKVLERSVCQQQLPLKSMKTLFMKFRKFEEEHGTEKSVELVKERAKVYVEQFSK